MTTVGRPVESRYVHATLPPCLTVGRRERSGRGVVEGTESEDRGKGGWTVMSLWGERTVEPSVPVENISRLEKGQAQSRTHLAPSGKRISTLASSTATSLIGVKNGTAATYLPPFLILTNSPSGKSYPTVNE